MSIARIAILGCGNPAQQWHLPTLAELAKQGLVEFTALCDLDAELAAKTGARYGVPHYSSVEAMLETHPDIMAVDIVTGDPTHHGIAKLIAEHGKHVMVEKPMAIRRLSEEIWIPDSRCMIRRQAFAILRRIRF